MSRSQGIVIAVLTLIIIGLAVVLVIVRFLPDEPSEPADRPSLLEQRRNAQTVEDCLTIDYTHSATRCLIRIALRDGPQVCARGEEIPERENEAGLMVAFAGPEEGLVSMSPTNFCVAQVMRAQPNAEVCDYITDHPSFKEFCVTLISEREPNES